jgi:DNA repair ATPase RecN
MKDTDKITLTVGQLKRLINSEESMDESYDDNFDNFTQEGNVVVNSLNKISNQLNKVLSSTKFGSKNFERYVQTALDSIDNAKRSYMV